MPRTLRKLEILVLITFPLFGCGDDVGGTPDAGGDLQQDTDADARHLDTPIGPDEPCVRVDEQGIDFGAVAIGGVASRTIEVTNCSSSQGLEINSIAMAGATAEFVVDALPAPLPDEPFTLGYATTTSFVVSFAPTAVAARSGRLVILSNDTVKSPLRIPLRGQGIHDTCPTAIARVRVDDGPLSEEIETSPLKTVQLDGANSVGPDGAAIEHYEWTLREHPIDSTTHFVPGASTVDPQLLLDLAGVYRVELRVVDVHEVPSCGPAELILVAIPDQDIRVELVWDTPGDTDQTDDRGTDLDLHLLHQGGTWDEGVYDCFFRNPTPLVGGWNPILDLDDTDGAGPETISLNQPDHGTYRVGVDYAGDNGYGPSHATVRIFVRDRLAFEYRDKRMESTGKFWEVAAIDWPSGAISETDQVYDDFP